MFLPERWQARYICDSVVYLSNDFIRGNGTREASVISKSVPGCVCACV